MVFALFDSLLVSGGGWKTTHPHKISGTAGRMTMNFLQDVKCHREARNPENIFDI